MLFIVGNFCNKNFTFQNFIFMTFAPNSLYSFETSSDQYEPVLFVFDSWLLGFDPFKPGFWSIFIVNQLEHFYQSRRGEVLTIFYLFTHLQNITLPVQFRFQLPSYFCHFRLTSGINTLLENQQRGDWEIIFTIQGILDNLFYLHGRSNPSGHFTNQLMSVEKTDYYRSFWKS